MPDDDKDKQNEKPPVRTLQRLFRSMGIGFPEEQPKPNEEPVELNNYSQTELRHIPGFDLPRGQQSEANQFFGQLQSYIRNIAQNNTDWEDQSTAIRMLTPEIDRAADIMVASIMSPTDIQTSSVQIVCKNSGLDDATESKINDLVTDFFNDYLDISTKTYKWVKDALYGTGSAAILVLPQSNVGTLNKAADLDWILSGRGPVLKKNVNQLASDDERLAKGRPTGSYEALGDEARSASDDLVISQELLTSLEKHNMFSEMKPQDIVDKSKEVREQIRKVMSGNGSHVYVTRDVSEVNKTSRMLHSRIEEMTKEVEKNFMFDRTNPVYLIDDTYEEKDHPNPAIIELPSRAVVPVSIPGSPDKHVGYFVLIDQWGAPLMSTAGERHMTYGPRRLTEAATQAAFGMPSLYRFHSTMTDGQRYDLTSLIFGITLRQLLKNKLDDYGLLGATIDESDAITNTIFRQVLMQRQCSMVFVPEPMMVYLRYDHRDDGTGKAITEDIGTLLSLRTVLLISYIMAATENSVNNKTITVAVDEKQTNVQQMLEMIRNAYVSKKMMRFDVNPLTVQQDLIQKSLTIMPKGVRGLSDSLDIQTEHRSTGAIPPDNELMEKMTDWIITALRVPHSALNQLNENEYSRSVASQNLYFSNDVKAKQKVTIKYISKFIQLYAKYSWVLRDRIAKIISSANTTDRKNKASEENETPKSEDRIELNDKANMHEEVLRVISHLQVSLPEPRIVVDRSQYAEVESYIGTIERICEALYSDDLLTGAAQELQDTMKVLRASLKEKMTREYIEKVGFQSIYNLPPSDEVNTDLSFNLLKVLSNLRKGVVDWMQQIGNHGMQDQNGGMGGGFGGGGGFGAGGSDFGAGGGNEFGGGGDFGGGSDFGGGETGGAGGEAGAGTTGTTGGEGGGTAAADDFGNTPEPPKF